MTALPALRHLAPAVGQPLPISRAQYDQMTALGMFDGRHVELIYGVIVEMNAMGPKHRDAMFALNRHLTRTLDQWDVTSQLPVAAGVVSSPEPDFTIKPPGTPLGDLSVVRLAIEVSDTTLRYDLGTKAQLYAEARVPEYWVIDLQHEVTVVHTAPRRGKYTKLRRVPWRKQLVSSAVAGLSMKLSELL